MNWGVNLVRDVQKATHDIVFNDFDSFFLNAQEKSGFFRDTNGEPYTFYKQQLHWLSLFDKDKPQRRALLGSRDKGKSEIVTILGSAWMLYNNPTLKIGIMSFKHENAEKLVNQIIRILEDSKVTLTHRAGGYYTDYSNAHTPNLMPLGLMSTVRGMHFDYLILDDPLTINEQFSKKYIDKSRYFLNEGASLSKNLVVIGQLLTRNDIYYDIYGDNTGNTYLIQSWNGDIPELDKDLNYLESMIGLKDVARNYLGYIEDKNEAIFSSLQFCNSQPSDKYVYAFIDPSSKGGDYTAIAIGWIHNAKIVIHGEIFKEDWGTCLEKLLEVCLRFDCRVVYFENNNGNQLGKYLKESGLGSVVGVATTANKIAKIYSLRSLVNMDKIRLSCNTSPDAVMQTKNWTETAEHDDMPDAISMLIQKMGWVL